jgi:hypothetical protein
MPSVVIFYRCLNELFFHQLFTGSIEYPEEATCWRGGAIPDEHISFYETLQQSHGEYRVPGYLAASFLEDQAWEHMYYQRRISIPSQEEGVQVGKKSKPRKRGRNETPQEGDPQPLSAPIMWQIRMHHQGKTLFKYRCKHVLFVQVRIYYCCCCC